MTGGVDGNEGNCFDGFPEELHAASVIVAEAFRRKLRRLVRLAITSSRVFKLLGPQWRKTKMHTRVDNHELTGHMAAFRTRKEQDRLRDIFRHRRHTQGH